jgi:hypothetical protein
MANKAVGRDGRTKSEQLRDSFLGISNYSSHRRKPVSSDNLGAVQRTDITALLIKTTGFRPSPE